MRQIFLIPLKKSLSDKRALFLLMALTILIRIPAIFQELPPYQFCDEAIFYTEVLRLINHGGGLIHEFRSGGFNIIPIFLFAKISLYVAPLSQLDILIAGRFFYLCILGCLTTYLIYKISQEIFPKPRIGLMAAFFYVISPFTYSVSRFWYPDHFIAFSCALFVLFFLKAYKTDFTNKKLLIAIALSLSLLVSTKYTGLLFVLLFCFLFLHAHTQYDRKKFLKLFFYYFLIPLILLTVALNYSALTRRSDFMEAFSYNINNYGERSIYNASGIIYYLWVTYILTLGIFAVPIYLWGYKELYKKSRAIFVFFVLFTSSYLIAIGTVQMVINRNIAIIIPFIFPIAAAGFVALWRRTSSSKILNNGLRLYLTLLILINVMITGCDLIHDFHTDSRVLARAWISKNIPAHTTIGINDGCSGESPASSEQFNLILDTQFVQKLDFYVINSYWKNSLDNPSFKTGLLDQLDQKYLHFYNFNDRALLGPNFWGRNSAPTDQPPPGYEVLQKFSSNGPDIFILKRSP
ncbi:phospholipid carrier-dependent glycosyltransferase [Polynucleobacter paneuropaeus]|nr:phospholipid carrier-dependent glycosyltransferase [Polynucleobacter paneuropaeus]